MDIMGGVRLVDGGELQIVTGLDDHSRFCICAHLVARATARPVCEALAGALRRHGVPEQILTDNGKVFTGRFGLGKGEVLFDRICRENGIRHLLTAPRSPTTTGKVERFHKTVRKEFLANRTFVSLEEAQAELDRWVESYNHQRPHQGIGMVFPASRFAAGAAEDFQPFPFEETDNREEDSIGTPGALARRKVSPNGRIRLVGRNYAVGRFLAGEMVEVEIGKDGLVNVYHRGVLVVTVARHHPIEHEAAALRRQPRGTGAHASTGSKPVLRLVDSRGSVSFAGTIYRAGNPYALKQVEVRLVRDRVEIWLEGRLIRTHPARHDKDKEHGAFGVPGGRPPKKKAS
jgi:hypothetical protein